jgi:hypothetical protein
VTCSDCITYHRGPYVEGTISGWLDGQEGLEFKTLEDANSIIKKHIVDKPLHRPKVSKPVTEYMVRTDKYMVRYRGTHGLHVYSVNGYHIASDKCAYGCKTCGAIFQSKGAFNHRMFPVEVQKVRRLPIITPQGGWKHSWSKKYGKDMCMRRP